MICQVLRFELPYPPSVNRYWRRKGSQYFIAEAGKRYRVDVQAAALQERLKAPEGRLSVCLALYPPDERERDADNTLKAIFDSMRHAGIITDDSRKVVKHLSVIWRETLPRCGKLVVKIRQVEAPAPRLFS